MLLANFNSYPGIASLGSWLFGSSRDDHTGDCSMSYDLTVLEHPRLRVLGRFMEFYMLRSSPLKGQRNYQTPRW